MAEVFESEEQESLIIRNIMLQRLLNKETEMHSATEYLSRINLDLTGKFWQLAVLHVDTQQEDQLLRVMECLRKNEREGYLFFVDDYFNMVLLFNTQPKNDESVHQLLARILCDTIDVQKVFACVGCVLLHSRQIAASYQECIDFIRTKHLFVQRSISIEDLAYDRFARVYGMLIDRLTIKGNALSKWNVVERVTQIAEKCADEDEKRKCIICMIVLLMRNKQSFHSHDKSKKAFLDVETQSDVLLEGMKNYFLGYSNEETKQIVHPHVKFALEEIAANMSEKTLSLQRIAEVRCVSAKYMGKLFYAQTGEFFSEYLLRVRLQAAVELLQDAQLSIGTISAQVGFLNQSYFNRSFRKMFGISPTEYRRKQNLGIKSKKEESQSQALADNCGFDLKEG